MSWNESTPWSDRVLGALPYLLPLMDAIVYGDGQYIMRQFPTITSIGLLPIIPFVQIYAQFIRLIPFAGLILFMGLFFAVVRNDNISRFIRFNVLQAILLDLVLMVCNLVLPILGQGLQVELIIETLFNTVFLGILATFAYSVLKTSQGQYAEIPAISDAVNMQIR
ncbi:Tic20 family protein [Acaryochloris sp. IP29b_bin.137]|uniref:Tic20 family protein n=1 Tax=Acaryochloris sp. IP29b_bin.137 TaxID=2969217 RepID=UPI0026255E33|nr:Tic20 family protein [Acaryochloris sp. IP29b_bin.137]